MTKLIYIAGPFRAATAWQIEANCRRAETVALQVWKLGAVAICPHLNTRLFQGELPDHRWLDGDLVLLARCDALVAIPGWEASTGTMGEIAAAEARGLPVFYNLQDLDRWLKETARLGEA